MKRVVALAVLAPVLAHAEPRAVAVLVGPSYWR